MGHLRLSLMVVELLLLLDMVPLSGISRMIAVAAISTLPITNLILTAARVTS